MRSSLSVQPSTRRTARPAFTKASAGHGFTLVELLVVISIIVVLAGLTWSVVIGVGDKADDVACQARLREIGLAIQSYEMEHGKYPGYDGKAFLAELYRSNPDLDAGQLICPASDEAIADDHVARAEAALKGKRGDPVGEEATTYFARRNATKGKNIRAAKRRGTRTTRIPLVCDGTFVDDDGVTRCSHGDYMFVLYLGGGVKRVKLDSEEGKRVLKELRD